MNTPDKSDIQKQTEESKQQAMKEAGENKNNPDQTIHTINPFTGTQSNITPEDLDGMEKLNEANTERD